MSTAADHGTFEETPERRERADRRKTNPPLFSAIRLTGRRKHLRRDDDNGKRGYYLDVYDPRLMAASLTILTLCVMDAFITLKLISHGAVEINLLMRLLIEEGIVLFLFGKYFMTAVSVVFLVIHNRFHLFKVLPVKHVLYGCASIYATLLTYELMLLRIA